MELDRLIDKNVESIDLPLYYFEDGISVPILHQEIDRHAISLHPVKESIFFGEFLTCI